MYENVGNEQFGPGDIAWDFIRWEAAESSLRSLKSLDYPGRHGWLRGGARFGTKGYEGFRLPFTKWISRRWAPEFGRTNIGTMTQAELNMLKQVGGGYKAYKAALFNKGARGFARTDLLRAAAKKGVSRIAGIAHPAFIAATLGPFLAEGAYNWVFKPIAKYGTQNRIHFGNMLPRSERIDEGRNNALRQISVAQGAMQAAIGNEAMYYHSFR